MKTSAAPADLQRWSDDVARDAASLSFLPLARAYRRQGRRDAALRICLRGLEHNPENVEAHSLLAVLYFESGQRVRAYDEWSIVLQIEPSNFDALRGMGFYYLEQEDYQAAERHLSGAAAQKPNDPSVQEASRIARERLGLVAPEPALPFELVDDPWAAPEQIASASSGAGAGAQREQGQRAYASASGGRFELAHAPAQTHAQARSQAHAAHSAPAPAPERSDDDPSRIFDSLTRGGQVLGALILDRQGLIMGGSLASAMHEKAEALGAILGGAIEEALRTSAHLRLGAWRGALLEADQAVLHFGPLNDDMIVLVAARKDAPTGWVLRSAQQANGIARKFLETYL